MSALEARGVAFSYGPTPLFQELSLRLPAGKLTAFIGANGSGKSTLLRLLARLLRPAAGQVLLDGRPIREIPTREVARTLAVLPQAPEAPSDLRIRELVLLGRFPHRRAFGGATRRDVEAADRALARCGLAELAERTLGTLSGGQRQLAWIAMALAQETCVLLLDEPTAALDAAHALEVLDLLRSLTREEGHTIVMALHDINLAARYADHMVALTRERSILEGTPGEILTADTMRRVFSVDVEILTDPRAKTPLCLPYRA